MKTDDAYTVPVRAIKTEDAIWDVDVGMRCTFGNSIDTIELPYINDDCRTNGTFAHMYTSGHGDGDKKCVGYGSYSGASVLEIPSTMTTRYLLGRQKGVKYHE